ncbi:MAG: hypothetical protein OEW35_00115 [Gammaproteobacteria bacterium]|nr:hypothetical protein [Gammaproteobacteria bacterium]MDH4252906.1 hypothetical protein [Gammaproteobacteria bacterium]MDH5308408.1 hypothetical protein [Gammaproteobacteria bacterium]
MHPPDSPPPTASSGAYAAELELSDRARRVVRLSGFALLIAGSLIAWQLPLPAWGKLLVAAGWIADCSHALVRQSRGVARLRRLRVRADGRIDGVAPDGRSVELELMPGSLLLDRAGWLRLRRADGAVHGELLLAGEQAAEAWRKLSILWRLGC